MNNWPLTLPQKPEGNNYAQQEGTSSIQSDMDFGPPKSRRLSTTENDMHNVSFIMNTTEYTTFKNFYKVTSSGGTIPFSAPHPVTGDLTVFKFDIESPPSYRYLGGINWMVQLVWIELYETT